jgi:hypothetical protein
LRAHLLKHSQKSIRNPLFPNLSLGNLFHVH